MTRILVICAGLLGLSACGGEVGLAGLDGHGRLAVIFVVGQIEDRAVPVGRIADREVDRGLVGVDEGGRAGGEHRQTDLAAASAQSQKAGADDENAGHTLTPLGDSFVPDTERRPFGMALDSSGRCDAGPSWPGRCRLEVSALRVNKGFNLESL